MNLNDLTNNLTSSPGIVYSESMTRPKYTIPDKNQAQIVKELRSLGFDVDIICDLPALYDIVVSGRKQSHNEDYLYINFPCSVRVEIKSKDGLMTDSELRYYERQKFPGSYIVAYKTKDVLDWFGYQK